MFVISDEARGVMQTVQGTIDQDKDIHFLAL